MESRKVIILAVSIIFFSLSSVFVGLYLCTCLFVVKRLRLADYLMLLAWMFELGLAVSFFFAIGKGFGLHSQEVKPQDEIPLNKATYAFEIFYDAASMTAKSSILIFFLSLTHGRKSVHVVNYLILLVVNVAGIALVLRQIFHCHPISAGFRFESESGHCVGIFPSFLASSPYNIVTDLAILLIPIPQLTRMTLPFRQKLIVVITFGVAIFVIVVDVTRIGFLTHIVVIQVADRNTSIETLGNEDYTWNAAFAFMWSTVEVSMTLICACVPTLKPLATRFSPSLLRNRQERSEIEGNVENVERAPSRSQSVAGEMMDVVTSRAEAETQVAQASKRDTEDVSQNEAPIINVLNLRPASVPKLNRKASFPPNVLITTLFFLWGFAYGLLLVPTFITGGFLNPLTTRGLHAAYYLGYLIGGVLLGRPFLKNLGFAGALIVGLYIYACGALLFWPSSILRSLPSYCISNSMGGIGLAILETTGNLFVAICGPLEYSEIRLCVAQSFQGIGVVCAEEIAKRVLFKSTNHVDTTDIIHAQWAYLAIAFLSVLLSILFYYLPLPEAPDNDLRQLAAQRPENRAKVWGMRTCYVTSGVGIWSQFFYQAGQEAHVFSFSEYVSYSRPRSPITRTNFQSIGNALFIVGRLLTAFTMSRLLKPRWTLFILYIGLIISGALCMHTTGVTGVTMAMMVYFFQSGIFPIIFAISMRGTAQHAKTAAALMAAAISGGSFSPFAQHAAASSHNEAWSYSVAVAFWSASALFALYLNFVPQAKRQVDPVPDDYIKEK